MTWELGDYASLNDLKNELHITSENPDEDALIQDYIHEASADIDDYTNRKFYARVETRYYNAFDNSDYRLLLLDDDLLVATDITICEGTITVESDEYDLLPLNFTPKDSVRLRNSTWKAWQNIIMDPTRAVAVTGSWGYNEGTVPPRQVHRACIKLAAYRYSKTFAPFESAGTGDTGQYEVSTDIPAEIQKIIAPFQKKYIGATSSFSR